MKTPDAASTAAAPVPQGQYVPARRHGDLIFTAGMTPRRDGVLIHHGPVTAETTPESCRDAVTLAVQNALAAARGQLQAGEVIIAIVHMTVFVAGVPGLGSHSRFADLASEYLHAELGAAGVAARAAIGVASLPANAAFEIQLIAAAGR